MQDSLSRLREMVIQQQTALAEQAQDHRLKGPNGYEQEQHPQPYPEEMKQGGFPPSDPKKRRAVSIPAHITHTGSFSA